MAELTPRLRALVDQMDAGLTAQTGDDFERLGEGLLGVVACTSLDDADATARMQLTPSGTSYGWQLSSHPETQPRPCEEKPDTHRHLYFEC